MIQQKGKLFLIKKRFFPTVVLNIFNIIQISAGCYFSLALNQLGQVFSFGKNDVNNK
jgi:alpha-tubulin suppressor-like RCC1 family protein